ncbi:hypothetical protein RhiirA4_466929 [Rhizophagus irregularis]|uniref:Uncharacterized protein n=1 Tax=Rhizophagus irregularis TaxID=588596 RepID=A0A2I1GUZ0_9GLOM|nr:hypothetical protein RhiirA4_466929 [Rhizophagus irregularis]
MQLGACLVIKKNPEEYQQAKQAEWCLLNFQLECAGNALDVIANETRLRSIVTGEVISIVGSSQVLNNDKDKGETSGNILEVRINFSLLAFSVL